MRIDLHVHSTASDGSFAPDHIARAARDGGLDVVALTDHDTAAGVEAAQEAAPDELTVLSGIEVSSTFEGADLHILGYLIDPTSEPLRVYQGRASGMRKERMKGMIQRLDELGIEVTYEEVLDIAGSDVSSLGRPHLARALLARGYVKSFGEAFDRWIEDGGPAFLPTEMLDPAEAIALIHEAGGVAVWAHPPMELLDTVLERLVGSGLDGLECRRPQHERGTTRRLLGLASQHELLVTGGSDWHTDVHSPLGTFHLEREDIAAFAELAGI